VYRRLYTEALAEQVGKVVSRKQ